MIGEGNKEVTGQINQTPKLKRIINSVVEEAQKKLTT